MSTVFRSEIHGIESNRVYVVLSVKARLKSAIVDIRWLLFGLYVNRVQSTVLNQKYHCLQAKQEKFA